MANLLNKAERHDLIRKIILNDRIDTQTGLVDALRSKGLDCTQATVSRDIKEMKLNKVQSENGGYHYADTGGSSQKTFGKLLEAFSSGYLHSDYSGNMVVIKTVVGMAPVCAYAVDAVQWPEVVGTLAGEDTIFIVTKSAAASGRLMKRIESLIK